MKNVKYIGQSLAIALSLGFSGCGSSGSSGTDTSNPLPVTKKISLSGIVVDGYVSGATACLDMNLDGVCQNTEPTTITAADGTFSFRDVEVANNLLLPVIVSGGTDTATNKPFVGELKNIIDSATITAGTPLSVTPLTDLIATSFLQSTIKNTEALNSSKTEIVKGFNLSVENGISDPMKKVAVFAKIQEIQKIKALLEMAVTKIKGDNLSTTDRLSLQKEIKEAFVAQIITTTDGKLDIDKLMKQVETISHITIPENEKNFISAQIVEIRKSLDILASSTTVDITNLNEFQAGLEKELETALTRLKASKKDEIIEVLIISNLDKLINNGKYTQTSQSISSSSAGVSSSSQSSKSSFNTSESSNTSNTSNTSNSFEVINNYVPSSSQNVSSSSSSIINHVLVRSYLFNENAIVDQLISAKCSTLGGIAIYDGFDTNNNGILDTAEQLSAPQILCNGADGAISLTQTSTESKGANCVNGGIKLVLGLDLNNNAILDATEITSTTFICNGTNGVAMNDMPSVAEKTTYSIVVNEPLSGVLTATDSNFDRLSYSIQEKPLHGVLTSFNPMDGSFIYEPNRNYLGLDFFTFKADDGKIMSNTSTIDINIANAIKPTNTFVGKSDEIKIVDFPDGQTQQTHLLDGATYGTTLIASLKEPASISGKNLSNVMKDPTSAKAPYVLLPISSMPIGASTANITITIIDGNNNQRDLGEREINFSYYFTWSSNGANLSITPSTTAKPIVNYYSTQGDRVQAQLATNLNAIFDTVEDGIGFKIGSILDSRNLGNVFNTGTFKEGSYWYKIDIVDFPIVDKFGKTFNSVEGTFKVTQNPIPSTHSSSKSISVGFDSLIQLRSIQFQLYGAGGTNALTFNLLQQASTGLFNISPSTGEGSYEANLSSIIVSDAFSFSATDGLLESNPSRFYLNINDTDTANGSSLRLDYFQDTQLAKLSWVDNFVDEKNYFILSYDSATAQPTEIIIPASSGTGHAYTYENNVTQKHFYKVGVVTADDKRIILAPGVLVANTTNLPTIAPIEANTTLLQSGLQNSVELSLTGNNPLVSTVSYYLNSNLYGSSTDWPYFKRSWNTTSASNGNHLIQAVLQMQPSSYVWIKQSVNVDNAPAVVALPIPTLSYTNIKGDCSQYYDYSTHVYEYKCVGINTGDYEIQTLPSATAGIKNVTMSFDSEANNTIASPNSHWGYSLNYCTTYPASNICSQPLNGYTFVVNAPIAGGHKVELTTTSNVDTIRALSYYLEVPIAITMSQPSNSTITGNTLNIEVKLPATQNPLRTTIKFGSITVLTTSEKDIVTTYDLTGLAKGDYTLQISTIDTVTNKSTSLSKTLSLL